MIQEEIDKIIMVGKFMGINNLFPYKFKKQDDFAGVYIAEDEDGYIDYVDVGINWYNPHQDWNLLMNVVDKIKELKYPIYIYQSHIQNTVEIFQLNNSKSYLIRESSTKLEPIKLLYNAIVEFVEFYNEIQVGNNK